MKAKLSEKAAKGKLMELTQKMTYGDYTTVSKFIGDSDTGMK